jgi:glyoxylate/hydroxypyruvate reductase A
MALLIKFIPERMDWWRDELKKRLPDLELRVWPEIGDPAEIEFAAVWRMKAGTLKSLPNLRFIFSLGAGVDHVLLDPDLPEGVPICRVVDPYLTQRMSEYVTLHVLRYHRRQPEFDAQQVRGEWRELYFPTAPERQVGILGLGELGSDAASKLKALGFDVAGWTRTPKSLPGIANFHGPEGLGPFLARSEILVCLLPLTAETRGILSQDLFQRLPKGAALINCARGGHLIEADLIPALDAGTLSYATLDVFTPEPLIPDHPFWRHPRITVSPHVASITDPRTVVQLIAENVKRFRAGEPLLHRVDVKRGY